MLYQGKRANKSGVLQDKYRWVRGFRTRKEAQTELTKLLRSMDDETYVEPSKETVSHYLDRWLATAKTHLAGKTFERYAEIVNSNIKPRLGSTLLSRLQPIQISELYTWCLANGRKDGSGGLSARTVLHIHRCLHTALTQAVLWQLRATNPADYVQAPRPAEPEMNAVDEDGSATLIASVAGTQFYIPVLYGLCTGLRRGEILAQRWSDIDFSASTLFVAQSLEETKEGGLRFKIPKGRKRRSMAIPALLMEALVKHRVEQEKQRLQLGEHYHHDLDLIIGRIDGSPVTPSTFSSAYAQFSESIGLKGLRFHDLRHSHASQLLRQGTSVKAVQERMGHANASITLNTYAHVMSGDDQKAVDILESRLRSAVLKQRSKLKG